jgi:hypothetical protein
MDQALGTLENLDQKILISFVLFVPFVVKGFRFTPWPSSRDQRA